MSSLQARGPGLHCAVFTYSYFCTLELPSAMGKVHQRKPMEEREAAIIRRMKKVGRLPVTTISRIVERNKTAVHMVLSGEAAFAKRGRKKVMQPKDVNHLVKTLRAMIRKAHARWEVTLAMLKKRAKCNFDDKVVRKALLEKKSKFRRLRAKPLLTKEDVKARFAFAKKHRKETKKWWRKRIQMHIDLKNFCVYTIAKSRVIAAMREVRGAHQAPGQGLIADYVVLPKALHTRTCALRAQ